MGEAFGRNESAQVALSAHANRCIIYQFLQVLHILQQLIPSRGCRVRPTTLTQAEHEVTAGKFLETGAP